MVIENAQLGNELLVQECARRLRQSPAKASQVLLAIGRGMTISYHGYQFTDYDIQRLYNIIVNDAK